MALTPTQAQRDALADAIMSGALRVSYQDKTVQYHSLAEMRSLLAEMDEALAGAAAPSRHARAAFSRE